MVVKFEHTIIAYVAVTAPRWSKNKTSFAKFELERHRCIYQRHLLVLNFGLFTDVSIFIRQVATLYVPSPARHNPWVCYCCADQLYRSGDLEIEKEKK